MGNEDRAITFKAIFNSARSTIDGGWRISLDISQDDATAMLQLATMRNSIFQVALVPEIGGIENISLDMQNDTVI